jgi:hypothetical protein
MANHRGSCAVLSLEQAIKAVERECKGLIMSSRSSTRVSFKAFYPNGSSAGSVQISRIGTGKYICVGYNTVGNWDEGQTFLQLSVAKPNLRDAAAAPW